MRKGFQHPSKQAVFWARVIDDGHIKIKKKRLLASEMRPPRICGDDMPELLPHLRNFLVHPESVSVNEPMRWKTAPIDFADFSLELLPEVYLDSLEPSLEDIGYEMDQFSANNRGLYGETWAGGTVMLAKPLEAVFHIRRSRSAPLGDYEAGPIPYLGNGFGSSPIAKYVTPFPGDRIFEFDAVVVSAFGEVTVQAQPFIAYGAAGTSLVVLEPRVPMSRTDLAFYAAWLATQMRGRFNWYYRSVPPRIRRFRVPESVPEGLQFAVHGHIPRPSTLAQARQIHLKSFPIEEIFDVKRPRIR